MAGGDDGAGPFPELAVFDLDACFWDKESEFLFRVLEGGACRAADNPCCQLEMNDRDSRLT